MNEITQILAKIEGGDAAAAEHLLPLVYEELRKLATARLAQEQPGQTLQATALVHEAYLRLIGPANAQGFDNRGHFFSAAAEAMRRILIDRARRRATACHGGERIRKDLDTLDLAASLGGLECRRPVFVHIAKRTSSAGGSTRVAVDCAASFGRAKERIGIASADLFGC